jgi:uncharacterized protein (TIGR00266 family)
MATFLFSRRTIVMLTATCGSCGKLYQLQDEHAGKRLRCKACGNAFTAPTLATGKEEDDYHLEPLSVATPAVAVKAVGAAPSRASGASSAPAGVSAGAGQGRLAAGGFDYEIFGHEMQYCEVHLAPGGKVIAEAGGMMFMTSGIRMETVFGDPSAKNQGFFGKLASAGKRMVTGESLFVTVFTNGGGSRETVGFASPFPGKLIPLHLDELGGEMICQKDSFVCGSFGIEVGIAFQKKIGVGLFGGEGFIMQRLRGSGTVMVHAGGTLMYRELAPGEQLKLDTGCLVALTPSVQYNIEMVGGLKNAFFGGEGLFLASLTGPGKVWLQSLPFSRLAGRVIAAAPQSGGSKGEGSLLGSIGNIVMGGDS